MTVDNLKVPSGASCTLQGTYVKGTVKVESKATLVASNVRVVGNVQAENAARVVVRDGKIVDEGGIAHVGLDTVVEHIRRVASAEDAERVRTRLAAQFAH
mgnify:CR=1 FL=1